MAKGADATKKKNGKKDISREEYRKRFSAALSKDYTPEEVAAELDRRSKNPFYLAKDLFIDAPRDVLGSAYEKEGFRALVPGMESKRNISPEARAKEIRTATRKRLAREKKEQEQRRKDTARLKANPSLIKGGARMYSAGGKATIARGSGAAKPQVFRKNG